MKYTLITLAFLSSSAIAQPYSNWTATEQPVKSGTNLCWRSGFWTPATAHPDCDGADLKPKPVAVVAEVSKPKQVETAKPTPPLSQRAPLEKKLDKVTFQAETLFDFDRSVIKPEGRIRLDNFLKELFGVKYEVVIVVGHTDSIGSDQYNMKLGLRRAEAVKAYLVSKGMNANQIRTSSKGEREPIADNKTAQGRAMNRRVVIEVNGLK
jgi:OOP family OmpA-OmpF porin